MADISKIKLPSGSEYDIKDEVARSITLSATYTAVTKDLELEFTTASSADNTEYQNESSISH